MKVDANTFLSTVFPLGDLNGAVVGIGVGMHHCVPFDPEKTLDVVAGSLPTYVVVSSLDGRRRMSKDGVETADLGRARSNCREAWLFVLDDIGTKSAVPAVEPSYKLQTSVKDGVANYQWGYLLYPFDVSTEAGVAFYEGACRAAGAAGISDPGMRGVYRLCRVPGSLHSSGFRAEITEWNPERLFDLRELCSELGLDVDGAMKPVPKQLRDEEQFDRPDVALDWLIANGYTTGVVNGDWVEIQCPNAAGHTDGSLTAGYSPLDYRREGRQFKCFHGHCGHMDTGWFLGWLEEMGGPAVGVTESVYMSEEARRRIQKAIKTSIPDVVVEDMVAGDARDELVREWIFCYGTGAYFRYNGVDRPTEVGIKPAAFNTMFLHLMPTHKGRTVITPDKWWSNQKDKKTVNQIVFEVDKPSGVFTDDDGVQQFNEYVPFMPKNVGANPVVANLWDSHIRLLLQDDADILIQWMAWIVQNPGVRITWSPVVIGPPGTGKTFIAKALEAAVGAHYTKVLGTDAFKDLFNNVTSGNILVVAEEIRVIGKERFTILDKLKPLITNDRIDVREHYRGRRTIKNTANFILFSNYCDALPIDSNERRWAVLPTRIESTYALEAAGMNADYFTQLHKSTTENPGAIYSWLMSIDVSRFNPKGRAPVTEGTSDMISDTTDLLYESIYDKLISGAYKDANESIFTNSVVTLLLKLDSDNFDKSRQITVEARWRNYLKSMGWTLVNRALRRNGILTKVWVNTLKVAGATKLTVEDQQALLDAHNETVGDGPNVVGMDALRAKKLGA